jgi:hypothetical protein
MKTKQNINSLESLRSRKKELVHENEKLKLRIEKDANEIKFAIKAKFSTLRAISGIGKFVFSSFSSKNKSGASNQIERSIKSFVSRIIAKFKNGREQSI